MSKPHTVIGITGGISTGKSTFSNRLRQELNAKLSTPITPRGSWLITTRGCATCCERHLAGRFFLLLGI